MRKRERDIRSVSDSAKDNDRAEEPGMQTKHQRENEAVGGGEQEAMMSGSGGFLCTCGRD